MHVASKPTAILLALLLGVTAPMALAQEATTEPMPLPPGEQPPDPPITPEPPPEPEIVVPPEAPPILFPVTVEWRIPDPDPAVSDDLRFVAVYCGTLEDPYKFGRSDFSQPGTRGVINLPAPAHCMAVAYYWVAADAPTHINDGYYRYSEPSAAVLVDPLKPAAPELVLPIEGMETTRHICQSGTVRCAVNALQSGTAARPAIRTRNCTCLLR